MTAAPAAEMHLRDFHRLDGGAPGTVRALRERGFSRFAANGLPTTWLEDWKYTSLAPLRAHPFALAGDGIPPRAAALAEAVRLSPGAEVVFINGRFAAALSDLSRLPPGMRVGSLAGAFAASPELIEPHLGRYAPFGAAAESLTALNTAFIHDGAFVYIPVGADVEEPIHCVFVSVADPTAPSVAHPRNLVIACEGSRATVVEHYTGAGPYWTNAVTEAVVAAGAALTHIRVQREDEAAVHVGTVAAAQGAKSTLASHAVSLGAALARIDIATRMEAPGATCSFDGLYAGRGAQHVDHHTAIDHRGPRCASRETYKGILGGRARGVFNGKVFVRPRAQQSDARQVNKNLLLSDDARVDSKPQLEIFADDVKCSHGATVGQLDEEAIFYLRSRGIGAAAARELLVFAFANEIIERIGVAPLRERLRQDIAARLQGDAR